jgi:ferric-dicitrate binding protein FerR (iron transport regulator)
MSDALTRTRELTRRHLDGLAGPAELSELDGLLAGNPAAAALFAELTRLEAGLSALTEEDADRREATRLLEGGHRATSARWRRWGTRCAAAAVLVIVVGLALWRVLLSGPWSDAGLSQVAAGAVEVSGATVGSVTEGVVFHVRGDRTAILRLRDGSEAELDPGSTAVLRGPGAEARQVVDLREGGGRFAVEPGGGPFRVETPLGRVTVLGTEFSVRLREEPEEGEGDAMMKTSNAILLVAVVTGAVVVEFGGVKFPLTAGQQRAFGASQDRGRDERGEGERRERPERTTGTVKEVADDKVVVEVGTREGTRDETFMLDKETKITADGKPGKVADLVVGRRVGIEHATRSSQAIAVVVESPVEGGVLKEVSTTDKTVTLATRSREGDGTKVFSLAEDAVVTVNGRPGKLEDLKAGEPTAVKVSLDGKRALGVSQGGRREGERGGDERRGGERRLPGNEVAEIDLKGSTITLTTNEGDRTAKLAEEVKVTIDGKDAELKDIKVGDRVLLKVARDRRKVGEVQVIRNPEDGRRRGEERRPDDGRRPEPERR